MGNTVIVQQPPNTVTGPVPATPAHAARPAPRPAARLAAFGAVLLVAIGLGSAIATQRSAGTRVHSTPSSALLMKEDPTSPAALSARHP